MYDAQYGGIIPTILKSKLPMDKVMASFQLSLDAQVPIETVNDLWRALWIAQTHWLDQPLNRWFFLVQLVHKKQHSWDSSWQILLLILKCYLFVSLASTFWDFGISSR